MTRRLLTILCACLLAGCATPPSIQKRQATAEALAEARGWRSVTLAAGPFDIAAWLPSRIEARDELTVYIEGDGLAWIANDMPSSDPTPVSPMGLKLALAQPEGNAAYLARPCQYVAGPDCRVRYWTNGRFAPEVIEAMGGAIDRLKARFQAHQLTLVGYSGGAAVAALLATRRRDVVKLITVAGNLDHRAWTKHHRATPLIGSLNPADELGTLARIPQWHFVGGKDKVVPPTLLKAFSAGMPNARVIPVEQYDHQCCWVDSWPRLWMKTHENQSEYSEKVLGR